MENNIKFILRIAIIYMFVAIFCSFIFSKSYYDIFTLDNLGNISYDEFLSILKSYKFYINLKTPKNIFYI